MNTKLMAALVIVGVLAVTVIGLVAAQIATSTPTANGSTNETPGSGFFGWMGKCLGFRGAANYGTQAPDYNQPENITVTNPYTNTTTTYQGYYGNRGCGMVGFYP